MLWQTTQGPSGFQGGGTVAGNSPVLMGTYAMNEVGLRVARNGYTKTLTASTFLRGQPVVLGTATNTTTPPASGGVWPNGFDIVLCASSGTSTGAIPVANPLNNLAIGLAFDYPDTSLARNGGWNPEDTGLVQCYGLNTKAILIQTTASYAAGLILVPDSAGPGIGACLQTAVGPVTASAQGTGATHGELAGIGGLFVLAQSIASSAASATIAASVFLRCL